MRNSVKTVMILTAESEGKLFTGEEEYYKDILSRLSQLGSSGYIFPISKSNPPFLGYYWDVNEESWKKTVCPIPDIVYNRYPFRSLEKKPEYDNFINWLNEEEIPYFNSSFFNKKTIAALLVRDKILSKYFPFTEQLTSSTQLSKRLNQYHELFVKDTEGSQGKGIWKIIKEDNRYHLFSQRKTFEYLTFKQLVFLLKGIMHNRSLLLQEYIPSLKMNNNVYDFRVLMLKHRSNWQCIGLGTRIAEHGGYTTHVKYGGRVFSIEDLPIRPSRVVIEWIGQRLGNILESHFPDIREFSFDLIMDVSEHYWVVDVNSKPMSFDERDIQVKRIEMLANILLDK